MKTRLSFETFEPATLRSVVGWQTLSLGLVSLG